MKLVLISDFVMRKSIFLVLFVSGALFLSSFSVAFGQMMSSSVGVARGDVFRYGYSCYFVSTDPNAVPSASFSFINQTDYFMINVTGVSGDSVDFDTTLRGLNGSENFGICAMNIGTGMFSISGYGGPSEASSFYMMARNVGMMGRMFPSANSGPTINDTVVMNYAGGQRLTNHFVTSTNQNGVIVQSDFYFDQATGMMVEWRQQNIEANGSLQTNSTQLMRMSFSSVWTIPEFTTAISLTVLVASTIVLTSAAMLMRKRRTRLTN
jgi:hypothetical protein